MSERKLVTKRTISKLEPINGADQIELAHVDGWQCIVKKGEFKVGDQAFYFEIDSFLPIKQEYEFLRKSSYKSIEGLGEGFRIKTMKMKGVLSQGLLLPFNESAVEVDGDYAEWLGVVKYEPPIPVQLRGQVKGYFPTFLRKTDQERIQNITSDKDMTGLFEVSLKLDGSSMTVYHKDGVCGVCSRNLELKLEDTNNTFVATALKLDLINKLKELKLNIAVQGELMGPGIQGNREGFKEHRFFVFDIWDIDSQRFLTPAERYYLVDTLTLEHVPVLRLCEADEPTTFRLHDDNGLLSFEDTRDFWIQETCKVKSINNPVGEGIVFKRYDGRFSFKIISNKFLLGEK